MPDATALSPLPTPTADPTATPAATILSPLPTPTLPEPTATASTLVDCRIGTHLREETVLTVLQYKDHPAMIMAPSYELAEIYFPQLEGWMRVLGAPSLAELEEKADKASRAGLPYEALGYGLETSDMTPEAEWQDLVGSTREAQAIAGRYGKLLVMGPGFWLMSRNEDKYAPMAALSDVWVLQTQVLQATSPGDSYRQDVERLVNLIRSSNPDIQIWAQITLLPDRPPDAAEWLGFRGAIDDLVDGTYLGIYTWKKEDPDVLVEVAGEVYATACGGR